MKIWSTQATDMQIAEQIMAKFKTIYPTLTLFELAVDLKEKSMNFKVSLWVNVLAAQFALMYGEEEGELVTRRVISCCLRQNQVLH